MHTLLPVTAEYRSYAMHGSDLQHPAVHIVGQKRQLSQRLI